MPPHNQPLTHQRGDSGVCLGAALSCVHMCVGAENPAMWGHWLLCVWPGAMVPQRGGNLVQALPTSPQIQGLHLTLVGQIQGRVVEDEPGGE